MSSEMELPAYSQQFLPAAICELSSAGPIAGITPEWAWGGSRGQGVRVAVVDSGIEWDHPAVGGMVRGGVVVEFDETAETHYRIEPEEESADFAGHGTACAGIIHSLAPEAERYSVRVLGRDMRGRAIQFAAGLDWAVDKGMHVANLSLSTSREAYYALFHEIADDAYFKNVRPGLSREQHSGTQLPVAVFVRRLGRRPHWAGPHDLLLQPGPTRRVWRAGDRCPRGLEGSSIPDLHRQQLCRPAYRRDCGVDPLQHPELTPFRSRPCCGPAPRTFNRQRAEGCRRLC